MNDIIEADVVVVIDDLRTFNFDAIYARNSRDGISILQNFHRNSCHIDQLWLDHDLGGDDTIIAVVDWICEQAVWDNPASIGTIYIHTSNPPGAATIERCLRRWYRCRRIDAAPHLITAPTPPTADRNRSTP